MRGYKNKSPKPRAIPTLFFKIRFCFRTKRNETFLKHSLFLVGEEGTRRGHEGDAEDDIEIKSDSTDPRGWATIEQTNKRTNKTTTAQTYLFIQLYILVRMFHIFEICSYLNNVFNLFRNFAATAAAGASAFGGSAWRQRW